jgi:hypothetical protein
MEDSSARGTVIERRWTDELTRVEDASDQQVGAVKSLGALKELETQHQLKQFYDELDSSGAR